MSDDGIVDRLGELTADAGGPSDTDETDHKDSKGDSDTSVSPEILAYMQLYEPIKRGLTVITDNVDKINKLKQKDRTTANEKARKEIMTELDNIMRQTTATGAQIKKTLEQIKLSDEKYFEKNKDTAKGEVRKNLYQTNLRRFHQVMNEYNAASHEFKQALQERTRRQLKIVDSTISDDEVEKIVESGQANNVIKQALLSDNLKSVVKDIEERHLDILKLESQVLEVYELFRDLATLVSLQQESLDVIEHRIQNAAAYTKQAQEQLVQAEHHQTKARQKKCCLLMILLGVLLAILVPSILAGIKKS